MRILFMLLILLGATSCASPYNAISTGDINRGMSKYDLRQKLLYSTIGEDPFLVGAYRYYSAPDQYEIIAGSNQNIFYVFERVSQPIICGAIMCEYGNGQLKGWAYDATTATSLALQSSSTPATPSINQSSSQPNNTALNLGEPAANGEIELSLSFTNDPYIIEIVPGGKTDVSSLIEGCTGFVEASRPDFQINYNDEGASILGFYGINSEVDTTVIVNTPSGDWFCNDDFDSVGGHNSGVEITDPIVGIYDIWIGTYTNETVTQQVYLAISEIGSFGSGLHGTISLEANFDPDPNFVEILTYGFEEASNLREGCTGYIHQLWPSVKLDYAAGDYTLSFLFDADFDATLAIKTPSDEIFCNDDFDPALGNAPGVVFTKPESGTYEIWVGNYSLEDQGKSGELLITEISLNEVVAKLNSIGGRSGSGTGVVVTNDGYVLTNSHVVDNCARLEFDINGQPTSELSLVSQNRNSDLALLRSDRSYENFIQFSGNPQLNLGQDLIVFGYPLVSELSSGGNLTTGIVSGLTGLNDDLTHFQMTAPIQPGNSGGPVLDRSGNLVGLVVSTANSSYFQNLSGSIPQNGIFSIRKNILESFLQSNNISYDLSANSQQLPTETIADIARSVTGKISCLQ